MGFPARVGAALLTFLMVVAATALADAFAQGTPPAAPPAQTVPPVDPKILQMEDELKRLRHQESVTEDPEKKLSLVNIIIALCIDLGRDCPGFEQKRDSIRAQIAKQGEKERQRKQNADANEMYKKRAREAIVANDLSTASTNLQHAIKLNSTDPETLDLSARLTSAQTNQLYRRIAAVVMATIVVLAVLIPVLKSRSAGVKVRELEMLEGPAPGDVFPLDKEKTSLGAVASEADIVITDAFHKISRRHCEISRSGKHYFLIDCSTNGTTVNDKPVPKGEPILLKKGDRIGLVDEVVLRFR